MIFCREMVEEILFLLKINLNLSFEEVGRMAIDFLANAHIYTSIKEFEFENGGYADENVADFC